MDLSGFQGLVFDSNGYMTGTTPRRDTLTDARLSVEQKYAARGWDVRWRSDTQAIASHPEFISNEKITVFSIDASGKSHVVQKDA